MHLALLAVVPSFKLKRKFSFRRIYMEELTKVSCDDGNRVFCRNLWHRNLLTIHASIQPSDMAAGELRYASNDPVNEKRIHVDEMLDVQPSLIYIPPVNNYLTKDLGPERKRKNGASFVHLQCPVKFKKPYST